MKHLNSFTHDDPFQPITEEDIVWLKTDARVEARQMVLEALGLCFKLASGMAIDTEFNAEFFRRWHGVIYSGTTYKDIMDGNMIIANLIRLELQRHPSDPRLQSLRSSYLSDAVDMRVVVLA